MSQLMGCDIETPKTRVDLALAADCRAFLGHTLTEQFMDYLWASPSFDSYSERLTQGSWFSVLTVPRVKLVSALMCWLLFAYLFMAVYSTFEPPTRMRPIWQVDDETASSCSWCPPLEVIFWLWTAGLMLNEIAQINEFERLSDYLSASGNWVDALLEFVFLLAFISRVVSQMLWQSEEELSPDRLQRCDDNYPACHLYLISLALLGMNFIFVGIRILYSLKIFREIGILLNIVGDIITKDVLPFLAVLVIFLVCFEVTGIFFILASDQQVSTYHMGAYVLTWLDVGNLPDLPSTVGHERWLNSAFEQEFGFTVVAHRIYTTSFFVLTGIILTNLLIAMMSDRFANVQAAATQVWRASFSLQVREYCDETILPIPFNALELALNMCMQRKVEAEMHRLVEEEDIMLPCWGRHYTWPLPATAFDLHFAVHRADMVRTKQTPEMVALERVEKKLLGLEARDQAKTTSRERSQKQGPSLSGSGIMVKIIDSSAIMTHSLGLAKELGMQKVRTTVSFHSAIVFDLTSIVLGCVMLHRSGSLDQSIATSDRDFQCTSGFLQIFLQSRRLRSTCDFYFRSSGRLSLSRFACAAATGRMGSLCGAGQ
jgi:hypothetical protein